MSDEALERQCSLETVERSVNAVIWAPVGPSHRNALSSPNSSSDEEEEKQVVKKKGKRTRQRSPKMKPRKLFKSCEIYSIAGTHELVHPFLPFLLMRSSPAATKVQVDQCSSEEEEKSPGLKSGLKDYQAAIKSKSWSRTTHNTGTQLPSLTHPLPPLLLLSIEPHVFTCNGFRSDGFRSATEQTI